MQREAHVRRGNDDRAPGTVLGSEITDFEHGGCRGGYSGSLEDKPFPFDPRSLVVMQAPDRVLGADRFKRRHRNVALGCVQRAPGGEGAATNPLADTYRGAGHRDDATRIDVVWNGREQPPCIWMTWRSQNR